MPRTTSPALRTLASLAVLALGAIVVIDGDTVDVDGVRYRLRGFDTPETYWARCAREREMGEHATARLRELVQQNAWNMQWTGRRDRYLRRLGTLYINDEDVADRAIREGWGVPYSGRGRRKNWCSEP